MTLFEFPSQYREKLAIWRMFGYIPFYGPLAEGHVFRWFAINIPMDLKPGGKFTSDIEMIACLRPIPNTNEQCDLDGLIYKTWEVKVSLLHENGDFTSLKGGKTRKILNQLQAHRDFGSPDVSLLEVYVLDPNMVHGTFFFPPRLLNRRFARGLLNFTKMALVIKCFHLAMKRTATSMSDYSPYPGSAVICSKPISSSFQQSEIKQRPHSLYW